MDFLAMLALLMVIFLLCALLLLAIFLRIILPLVVLLGLFFVVISVVALYPASIIWAYMDAEARGKPGWALALLITLSPFFALIGWPLALLAWVVFRPEKKSAYKNIGSDPMTGAMGHA